MQSTFARTAQIVAILVLAAAVTQALYTALAMADVDVPRQLLWGSEGLLFVLTAAFAGSALAQASRLHLVWSAITAAAVLNVVQVGVGLTMFGPFREAAQAVPEMAPAASGVVAFSFMVYNAAKVLLALALITVALAKISDSASGGAKVLGALSVAVGAVALVSNTLSMALGRGFIEVPIAGGSGVLATVLLAVWLFGIGEE